MIFVRDSWTIQESESFIYSFYKNILGIYYMPGTVLGTGDTILQKQTNKQRVKRKGSFPLEASIMMGKIDNKQIPWTNKYIMYQLLVSTLEHCNNIIVMVTFFFGIILGQNGHVKKKGGQKRVYNPQLVGTKSE